MKITFLGTGASEGIPALFCNCKLCCEARAKREYRTRSQLLINDDLLIDFPPDTYMHSLLYGVDLGRIENMLITHSHSDHFYPEDFWARGGWASFNMSSDTLTVHGNDATNIAFDRIAVDFDSNTTPNECVNGYRVTGHNISFVTHKPFETFTVGKYSVTALPAVHTANEQSLNYLVESEGKTVLYATDTGYPQREYFDFLEARRVRLDGLIADSTYGLYECTDIGHMDFRKVVNFRQALCSCGAIDKSTRCFCTHIFHGAASDSATLRKAVPVGFALPFDGETVTL